jgi:hypothetical protein
MSSTIVVVYVGQKVVTVPAADTRQQDVLALKKTVKIFAIRARTAVRGGEALA